MGLQLNWLERTANNREVCGSSLHGTRMQDSRMLKWATAGCTAQRAAIYLVGGGMRGNGGKGSPVSMNTDSAK